MVGAGWGTAVTTNSTGANMPAGHVAALVQSSFVHTVLEVDEAWLPEVVRQVKPVVVVLLNLSRDQLDRANEVRQMAERWQQCLKAESGFGGTVVANANDPLVVYAAMGATNVRWCDVPTQWMADAKSCPRCTLALNLQTSTWSCVCGFAKPTTITTTLRDGLSVGETKVPLELSIPGAFNEANAALAITALCEVGVPPLDAVERINAVRAVAGRFTLRQWNGHTLQLLLAKNPSGFDALLSTVQNDEADVWVAINARVADGRDPSWLYDVPFEKLRGHRVWCFGDRRLDLATRLDYGGVAFEVVDDLNRVPPSSQPVALLANYTAFSEWLARSAPC
jgi:UDP-N-acetylmuramyl tripeptide synthase